MKRKGRLSESHKRYVRKRSGGRCEYCRFPLAYDLVPPAVDHIIARQHGGSNDPENLAHSCFSCNVYKGTNVSGIDPDTLMLTRLFNPRKDRWEAHFCWHGATLVGITAIGRTTVRVLAINTPHRVVARETLKHEGVF
jgi:5-methylcytosine-specific restriction endonuclease McrA